MIDYYAFEDSHKIDREMRERDLRRHALWAEHARHRAAIRSPGRWRRRLAQVLLALADRLDPRPVVRARHVPHRPTLNGTFHHA